MIHLYGFVIGIAIVVGLWLMEIQAKKHKINASDFYQLSWVIILGGIIGARLYHVITDFYLYQNQLLDAFKIWQGGMSIIGGVMGGVFSAWLFLRINSLGKKVGLTTLLDLSVFGLPVAQAIGRWGNFFNQELYGTPTQLPWKIYIEPVYRLAGYEQFSYFQPLFFYEMMLMLLLAGVVWYGQKQAWFSGFSIGTGKLFSVYILYYSFIRFLLDFIRIDKTHFFNTSLGLNQVFLIGVMIVVSSFWLIKKWKRNFYLPFISSLLILLGCGLLWFKNISVPIIDPDEVVWVLDARFYNFRQQRDWKKFMLTDNPRFLGWSDDKFRLIDQPQLGKYIYGLIINLFDFDPWDDSQSTFLYKQFASMRLDTSSIKTDEKYSEIMNSINVLRVLGSVAGFVSIIVFGLATYFLTKSKVTGGLTSIFLFSHPTLYHWYRLAVPNSFQILLIIVAVSLIFYLLNNIKYLCLKRKVLWLLVGMLIAASTSIKLNGVFILTAPVFVWMVHEMKASFFQQEVFVDLANKIKAYFFLLIGFSTTFYFLEPELWGHPVRGLKLLFGARLDQHHRFLSSFENYGFFETCWFLMIQFLRISDFLMIKLLLVLFLTLGIKKIIDKSSDYYWLNLSLLMLFIFISNIFYANVGFDRYAEWSAYVFSFLSALGVGEFIKIIHQKLKKQ